MNLISDPWIPIRRADGSRHLIAPWELTDGIHHNPILAVASPRPDFDGALTQFLIGVLQTTCTPDEEQWWNWREAPPSTEAFKKRLTMHESSFELEHDDGSRFLQEQLGDKAEEHPVTYLLIGAPTDNALRQNIDHFQKRPNGGECFCRACAAAALYTLQAFAPSGGGGGDGKFTSLRGGGPLTTLILGGDLWETAWLNVVHGETFSIHPANPKTFPWLDTAAFISEHARVKTIHSSEMNPEHVFWGMPRRIRLDFATNDGVNTDERLLCAVCGSADKRMCVGYHDLTGGLTYQEEHKIAGKDGKASKKKRPAWISPTHPLSPHTANKENRPLTVHPQPGGIGYRHWLGLIENDADGRTQRLPATVVEQFRKTGEDALLWAFGFDMDNMKARCWYDATMPVFAVQKELKELFIDIVRRMVKAAEKVAKDLSKHLKAALFGEKSKVRADDLSFSRSDFWASTESAFYMHLRHLRDTLPNDPFAYPVLERWHKALSAAALSVFDRHSQTGDFDAVDPRRIAAARNNLGKALVGAPLKEKILHLPKPPRMKTTKGTRRRP